MKHICEEGRDWLLESGIGTVKWGPDVEIYCDREGDWVFAPKYEQAAWVIYFCPYCGLRFKTGGER